MCKSPDSTFFRWLFPGPSSHSHSTVYLSTLAIGRSCTEEFLGILATKRIPTGSYACFMKELQCLSSWNRRVDCRPLARSVSWKSLQIRSINVCRLSWDPDKMSKRSWTPIKTLASNKYYIIVKGKYCKLSTSTDKIRYLQYWL